MHTLWKAWTGSAALAAAVAVGCRSTPTRMERGDCPGCGSGTMVATTASSAADPATRAAVLPPSKARDERVPDRFVPPSPASLAISSRASEEQSTPGAAPPRSSAKPAAGRPAPESQSSPNESHAIAGSYHNLDYTVLVGVLHFNPRQNRWRLRYAPVSGEDRYGGSVTLDSSRHDMTGFTTGQAVRVEGALRDAQSREISPPFSVRSITPAGQVP